MKTKMLGGGLGWPLSLTESAGLAAVASAQAGARGNGIGARRRSNHSRALEIENARPGTLRVCATFSLAIVIAACLLAGCSTSAPPVPPHRRDLAAMKAEQQALTPAQVLDDLRHGNERFASGQTKARDMLHDQQVTAAGQYPHAVILSCINSRAPAELIFDAGLGDLFNARIAGNIADADLVGSMEFACAVSGAKLVLVMGHTSCGAIKGACDHVELGNLTGLLKKIEPAIAARARDAGRTELEEPCLRRSR